MNDKEKVQNQIVHEAEITRQHTRYKIPANIEIDNKLYRLSDWSLSGCAIEGLSKSIYDKNEHKKARLIFNFGDFSTYIDDIELDFVSKRDDGTIGGRFHNLKPSQIAILNQIITAFLNGDIIAQGDLINAVSKQITYPKKIQKKVNKKKADTLLIIIYGVIAILISFLLFVAYMRLFVVKGVNAHIDIDTLSIRSPHASYIKFIKDLKPGDKVEANETLAIAYFVNGGAKPIQALTNGVIYSIDTLNNQFKEESESILKIIPNNTMAYITAYVDHDETKKLKIGYYAKVILPNSKTIKAKIVRISPVDNGQNIKYSLLTLRPNEPINLNMIKESAYVTIDTLLN